MVLSRVGQAMGGAVVCAVLLGCGKGDRLPAPSRERSCSRSAVIDGAFTDLKDGCVEYPGQPAIGKYTDFYAAFGAGTLSVLNDWHLRDDAPVEPGMYNRFTIGCAGAQYLVRVYADGHVEAFRDGSPLNETVGATGFAASPRHATPHTLFELRLATDEVACVVRESDPGSAGQQGEPWTPESVLVEEPTSFIVEYVDGATRVIAAEGPAIVATEPPAAFPGQKVALVGAGLGGPGSVHFGAEPAEVLAWSADHIDVVVPNVRGKVAVRAESGGAQSNALSFLALCTPQCGDKACGDDACGGTCGTCLAGTACLDGACQCAPSCEGRSCGGDGCGGSCGACGPGTACQTGRCVCPPDCTGKQCGDDGCGGACGVCDEGTLCSAGTCVFGPN